MTNVPTTRSDDGEHRRELVGGLDRGAFGKLQIAVVAGGELTDKPFEFVLAGAEAAGAGPDQFQHVGVLLLRHDR